MKIIFIFGYQHTGSTVLRSIIGHIDNVYEVLYETDIVTNEMIGEAKKLNCEYILIKNPHYKQEYFTKKYINYHKIFLVRNPYYVFSLWYKRITNKKQLRKTNNTPEHYLSVLNKFLEYSNLDSKILTKNKLYCIKYEDMFNNSYKKLINILKVIGLQFSNDIFDNNKYVNANNILEVQLPYKIYDLFYNNKILDKLNYSCDFNMYIYKSRHTKNDFIKNLDDKLYAKDLVHKYNVNIPKTLLIVDKLPIKQEQILSNCVIKYNNLSSSRNIIYVDNNNYYINNIDYKIINKKKIKNNLKKKIIYNVSIKEVNNLLSKTDINVKCGINKLSIKQKLFVEEKLINYNGSNYVNDFKFFCFYGKIKYIQITQENNRKFQRFYDINLNRISIRSDEYDLNYKDNIPFLNELIDTVNIILKNIIKDYPFVRIDMYYTNNGPYFGEFTFFPGTGNNIYYTKLGLKLLSTSIFCDNFNKINEN